MEPLSNGWAAVFYVLAVICFALDGAMIRVPRVHLIGAGLAFAFVVLAWNALALT